MKRIIFLLVLISLFGRTMGQQFVIIDKTGIEVWFNSNLFDQNSSFSSLETEDVDLAVQYQYLDVLDLRIKSTRMAMPLVVVNKEPFFINTLAKEGCIVRLLIKSKKCPSIKLGYFNRCKCKDGQLSRAIFIDTF